MLPVVFGDATARGAIEDPVCTVVELTTAIVGLCLRPHQRCSTTFPSRIELHSSSHITSVHEDDDVSEVVAV